MTVLEQIQVVDEKQAEVDRLVEKREKQKERRRKLEQKIEAFDDIQSTIDDLRDEYRELTDWRDLADEMGVEYDADGISESVAEIESEVHPLTQMTFDDAPEALALRDTDSELDSYRNDIQNHRRDVQQAVEDQCGDLLDELTTTLTVLRIPDIGTEDDKETVETFQSFLEYTQNGNLQSQAVGRYRELADEYEDIQISYDRIQEEYGLGEEAMTELRKLLNNERVTLAEIDETVLNDLKNLTQFSELLTIQFGGDD